MRGRIIVAPSTDGVLLPLALDLGHIATESPFFDEVRVQELRRPISNYISLGEDEDYVVVCDRGLGGKWMVLSAPHQHRPGSPELHLDSTKDVLRWFKEYRARLEQPRARPGDREASRLLDVLGALLQQNERLVALLAQALADREAAERRADMLQRELDQLRAANAEPDHEARRTMRLGIATVVISALTGIGGFAAGTVQAHATERAARIGEETALTQTIIEQTAGSQGSLPTDPRLLADAVRQAAERLKLACQ